MHLDQAILSVQLVNVAGIAQQTMMNWLNPDNKYYRAELMAMYKRALGLSTASQIDKIRESIDWRAAAFWLERNIPEYAPATKDGALRTEAGEEKQGIIMSPEACKELSDAYDKRSNTKQRGPVSTFWTVSGPECADGM